MVDLTSFKSSFKGDIVEPDSPDYPAALIRWAANAERKARYVMYPRTEEDVSLILKFATSNNIALAIKCGGHNPSGASSVEDGLCIDMSRYFDKARVDTAKNLVYVGGGSLWKTVNNATAAHGLATPGGTVSHTGVGGLIMGGGYGFLSGEHGLVIDNLVQVTLVTADGTVLNASESSHTDLFWGVRGGGANFGIVTEFVLRVHPQPGNVFGGPIIFPSAQLNQIVDAVDKWHTQGIGEKEVVGLTLTRGPNGEPVVVAALFYNGSEAEGRANFKWLYDLKPIVDHASEMPYARINSLLDDQLHHGKNYYMSGTTLRSRISPHIGQLFDTMVSASADPGPKSPLPRFQVDIVYELFSYKKISAVPPDATALRSRGEQANVILVVSWDKQAEDKDGLRFARETTRELARIIESTEDRQPKEYENEIYQNYVSELSLMSDRVRQIWGENYPRLQTVKQKYDPSNVFNRWFPIQPKA